MISRERDDPVRFGVLVDRSRLEAWHLRCLDRLRRVEGARCALLVFADVDPDADAAALDAPIVRVTTSRGGPERLLDASSDAAIGEGCLDFLLVLTDDVVRGGFVSTLRYGAWAFRFGASHSTATAAFWAMHDGAVTIDARLERLCPDAQYAVPLRCGTFGAQLHATSATAETIELMTSYWPAQVCRDLVSGVASYVEGQAAAWVPPPRRAGGSAARARVALRSAGRYVRAIYDNLFHSYGWHVGVLRATPLEVLRAGRLPPIEWMPSKSGTYFADPFPFERDGKRYVACEEFDYRTRHGAISIAELDPEQGWKAPVSAIVRPYHMSYPFVFEDAGSIYCLPETSDARKVILYVADRFPEEWHEESVLVDDFAGVDNTLVRHDGRWWLFSTNQDEDACASLWIFHAAALHGPWMPHRDNPVKVDVTSARPAGSFFCDGTTLYRPAQDCSERYGVRVVIHRVDELSPQAFREDVAAVIEPDCTGPYPSGIHTIAGWADWSVVDGSRYAYGSAAMRSAARYYAAKLPRKAASLLRGRLSKPYAGLEPLSRLRT